MTTLTCQACAEFLVDYLNGEIADEVRARFETHLDRCRNCRAYLEQYAAVIKAGQHVCERENASAAFPEELVQAILEARKAGA